MKTYLVLPSVKLSIVLLTSMNGSSVWFLHLELDAVSASSEELPKGKRNMPFVLHASS